MSYDEKSKKTLTVVRAMEEALIAKSNDMGKYFHEDFRCCLLYTSPSPRDQRGSRMPSSA